MYQLNFRLETSPVWFIGIPQCTCLSEGLERLCNALPYNAVAIAGMKYDANSQLTLLNEEEFELLVQYGDKRGLESHQFSD